MLQRVFDPYSNYSICFYLKYSEICLTMINGLNFSIFVDEVDVLFCFVLLIFTLFVIVIYYVFYSITLIGE